MSHIVRCQVMSLRHRDFVDAAQGLGVGGPRILLRHILASAVGPIIVYATLLVPGVMPQEVFLSFLGLGVQAPRASWGTLVAEGSKQIVVYPWLGGKPCPGTAVTMWRRCLFCYGHVETPIAPD